MTGIKNVWSVARVVTGNYPVRDPSGQAAGLPRPEFSMLVPQNALRILCRRTGGTVSRATFYRWARNGRIPSVRLGSRVFIPWPALEGFIRRCLEGEDEVQESGWRGDKDGMASEKCFPD